MFRGRFNLVTDGCLLKWSCSRKPCCPCANPYNLINLRQYEELTLGCFLEREAALRLLHETDVELLFQRADMRLMRANMGLSRRRFSGGDEK